MVNIIYFINALHLTQIREVNALQHILLDKIAMDYSEDEMMQLIHLILCQHRTWECGGLVLCYFYLINKCTLL